MRATAILIDITVNSVVKLEEKVSEKTELIKVTLNSAENEKKIFDNL